MMFLKASVLARRNLRYGNEETKARGGKMKMAARKMRGGTQVKKMRGGGAMKMASRRMRGGMTKKK